MSPDALRSAILAELSNIAPDMDVSAVAPNADLREALDIDSMDFLNFVTALHKKLGVEVPERDYPKLVTLAGAIAYLEKRFARPPG